MNQAGLIHQDQSQGFSPPCPFHDPPSYSGSHFLVGHKHFRRSELFSAASPPEAGCLKGIHELIRLTAPIYGKNIVVCKQDSLLFFSIFQMYPPPAPQKPPHPPHPPHRTPILRLLRGCGCTFGRSMAVTSTASHCCASFKVSSVSIRSTEASRSKTHVRKSVPELGPPIESLE